MPEIPQADVWLTERLGDVEAEASDLVVLIGAWYQHVGKVHVDLPYGDDDRTVWGAYDLVAAVTLRSKLENELGRVGASLASRACAAVDEVDQIFVGFTEGDDRMRLIRLAEANPDLDEWWWRRIPIGGPARRELDRFVS